MVERNQSKDGMTKKISEQKFNNQGRCKSNVWD